MEERKLKIYPKYVARAYKGVILPEIRLCGRWLESLGFIAGKSVTIIQEKNKIVITVQDEEK
ncbi:MAG TPA: SymE family type I addiction module toxin [Bacteroidia bacterium]